LSPEAKDTIRTIGPLLAADFLMGEIARSIGRSQSWVTGRVRELREELEVQLERA
jgi:DNA-binding Lrp family transcriptional regulator